MSEDFLLALHLDFIPTGYAQATSPRDKINVMRRHKAFLKKHSQRSHHGTPQGTGRFPSDRGGGGTNLQLLLQMTNSTSPVVSYIEPTGTPGK